MFEYAFMRRAFAVGLLLGVIMPCIGVMIVLKRLSMLGDASLTPHWRRSGRAVAGY